MSDAHIETIINYYELADGLVSSGQPNADELAAIRDAGYQVVINLVPSDQPDALPNEEAIVKKLDMEYIHIPVIWNSPQLSDFQQYVNAMAQHRGKKIFLHCQVNYRGSSFLYLYRRKYLGVDEKQARQDLQWVWAPNPTWTKYIQDVMETP